MFRIANTDTNGQSNKNYSIIIVVGLCILIIISTVCVCFFVSPPRSYKRPPFLPNNSELIDPTNV